MITNKWLIDNGFEYKVRKDGGFWSIKIALDDDFIYSCDNEIYQVSEDRSIVQYYDGLDVYNLSDVEFMRQVESLGKSK